jgi:L-asparaginase
MAKNMVTGALEPLDFDHLSAAIPELKLLPCEIHSISFKEPIDSSDMQVANWLELARMIQSNYDLYDGFVVLHGSDTMAYTASALSFLLENLQKPVILTGSQLPVGILRTDARENLISSLELAIAANETGAAIIAEVAVYFEYKLYRGNRTFKNSSENFEAFQSPNYPILAEMGVDMKINWPALWPKSQEHLKVYQTLNNNVAVVALFPGFNENIIYKMAEAGTRGLILRTFGAGNGPSNVRFIAALKEVISSGIPIVNVSQCRFGSVDQNKYAAGRVLQDVGVISGKDITLEAAITKMMFLLGQDITESEIVYQFGKSLRGEISA